MSEHKPLLIQIGCEVEPGARVTSALLTAGFLLAAPPIWLPPVPVTNDTPG